MRWSNLAIVSLFSLTKCSALEDDKPGRKFIPGSLMPGPGADMLCKKLNKELVLVFYTKLDDFEARNLRRQELRAFGDLMENIGYFFPLGYQPEREDLQIKVEDEMASYNDIFIGDYVEEYQHMAEKMSAYQEFLRVRCDGRNDRQKYISKIDTDNAINLGAMYEWTQKHQLHEEGTIAGFLALNERVQTGNEKNAEPGLKELMDTYPPFVYGGCSIYDTKAADVMLQTREMFPTAVRTDDLFVGILVQNSTVRLHNDKRYGLRGIGCVAPEEGSQAASDETPSDPRFAACHCSNWFCMDIPKEDDRLAMTSFAAKCQKTGEISGHVDPGFLA